MQSAAKLILRCWTISFTPGRTKQPALLRIAEIEHSRRLAGFREVVLADLVREVGDLYEPIAEDKGVAFVIETKDAPSVRGDRDLLFEAIANLWWITP
jgi:signal transduction histidine kinase